jgi:hypothetical protein
MDAEQLEFGDGTSSRVPSTWHVSQVDDVRAVLDALELGGPGEQGWITEPTALAGLLKEAGFSGVTVQVESHAFRYADLDVYLRTARGTGERRRLDVLDVEQAERVRSVLAARVAPYQQSDGLYIPASALLATAAG